MDTVQDIAKGCVGCNICTEECAFLQKHGNPGTLCDTFLADGNQYNSPVFECNLCGLCEAICPKDLKCPEAFLDIRKSIQKSHAKTSRSASVHKQHKALCSYESRGRSSLFSLHLIPEGCESIFFPGCTLAATRSQTTQSTYEHLTTLDSTVGIVLDCCSKPSHDMGLDATFQKSFSELCNLLTINNISKVITACPSCYITFQAYAPEIEVVSVYEILATNRRAVPSTLTEKYTIHDTCPTRHVSAIHHAVRTLVKSTGADVCEMEHSRSRAICCGEGAAAAFIAPKLASSWKTIREGEAGGRRILTYCAGCSNLLGKDLPTTHLLDLLFDPMRATAGKERIAKAPFTYLNRLRLKHRLGSAQKTAHTCNRASVGRDKPFSLLSVKFGLLLTTLIAASLIHFSDSSRYLAGAELQQLLLRLQGCPPILYIAAFAISPLIFLPATPFVMAGGVIYGQVWGLVYAMIGATLGAAIAFLVSRYVSSDFITAQLKGPKWAQLQQQVEQHGWKVVATTRLIPLFPYNLVNYAFGMTPIKFSHYLLATFVCMLPSCTAFIVFSSSLLELLNGNVSHEFSLGLALIFLVSLIPVYYQKIKPKG